MTTLRVAINGFGRIGRAFYRLARENKNIEVVAINDLGDIKSIAYLLKYDSVYGVSPFSVEAREGEKSALAVDGVEIPFLSEPEPSRLPWKDLAVDIVVESTGVFADYGKANAHREAGAKRVVVTAPVKGEAPEGIVGKTVLVGVNDDELKTCDVSSNASCTTNAGSPVLAVLEETFGIEHALLNTVHGYTASQSLVDGPSKKKDPRRGRAAAVNIVPSSTGAAVATTKAHRGLEGKFDGIAIRVPVVVGSIVDITFISKKPTTADEVNGAFRKAASDARWEGVLDATDEPIVSSDIIGNPHGSIVDLSFTRVVGDRLVKVLAWYDNEVGYANTLLQHVIRTGSHLK